MNSRTTCITSKKKGKEVSATHPINNFFENHKQVKSLCRCRCAGHSICCVGCVGVFRGVHAPLQLLLEALECSRCNRVGGLGGEDAGVGCCRCLGEWGRVVGWHSSMQCALKRCNKERGARVLVTQANTQASDWNSWCWEGGGLLTRCCSWLAFMVADDARAGGV